MKRRPISLLGLAFLLAFTSPMAYATYTISVRSGSSSQKTVQRGEKFDLDVVLTSNEADEHDSAIFRLVFSAPGLSYEGYTWLEQHVNNTANDDSKPQYQMLPLRLDAATLAGNFYPTGVVDVELSNLTGARAKFSSGTIVRISLSVPSDYVGPTSVTISAVPDTFSDGFRSIQTTSGASLELSILATSGLIPFNSPWRYLANGSNQGDAWRGRDFNDSSWLIGNAPLGFGNGDERTLIQGGSASSRIITSYFRKTFTISNPNQYPGLVLRLIRDDGAVVYMNGNEIFRSNLPTGAITFTSLASEGLDGGAETAVHEVCLPPGLLADGPNVVAVEVHQSSGQSSDLRFDFELAPHFLTSPGLDVCRAPSNFLLVSWKAGPSSPLLEQSDTFGGAARWTVVTNAVSQGGGVHCVLVPIRTANQFFRLTDAP
jgi:hypothetical protein